jgi:hypothetical protein
VPCQEDQRFQELSFLVLDGAVGQNQPGTFRVAFGEALFIDGFETHAFRAKCFDKLSWRGDVEIRYPKPVNRCFLSSGQPLVNGILADFAFVSPSDLSRAVAQLISPAIKRGGFLGNAVFPAAIAIADQSQSGKTHLMKIISRVYGETSYVVINKAQRGDRLRRGYGFTPVAIAYRIIH